jgi:hypothetical protein
MATLVGPEPQRPDLDLDGCAGGGDLAVDLEQVPGSVGEQDPGLASCGGLATGELGEAQEHWDLRPRRPYLRRRLDVRAASCGLDHGHGHAVQPPAGLGVGGRRGVRVALHPSVVGRLRRASPGQERPWQRPPGCDVAVEAGVVDQVACQAGRGRATGGAGGSLGGRRRRIGYGHRGQPGEEQNDHHQGGHTE